MMDRTTAYKEMLTSTTAGVKALRAMLPDEAWGDETDHLQRGEIEILDQVVALLEGASIAV